MMNQMNLNAFNPLNVIHHGGKKVEHPAAGYSNTISQNVEGMHREFGVFHKNLNNLVMLYKTRHQLMESLNENGLYTAKCYNEMFDGSPLSPIVIPGGQPETVVEEQAPIPRAAAAVAQAEAPPPSAPPAPAPFAFDESISFEESEFAASKKTTQPKSLEEKLGSIGYDEDIETIEYPDSGVVREKLDPDEGSRIAHDLSRSTKEPEGLKASKKMSMNVTGASYVANEIEDIVEAHGTARQRGDPPSSNSLTSGGGDSIVDHQYERKRSADPPSAKGFPDDETCDISVEKNSHCENDGGTNKDAVQEEMGGGVNVIVDDDDDSFTNGRVSTEKEEVVMNGAEKGQPVEENEEEDQKKEPEKPLFAPGIVFNESGKIVDSWANVVESGPDIEGFKEILKNDIEQDFAPFPDTIDDDADDLREERNGEEKQDYAPFPEIAVPVDEPEIRRTNTSDSESSTDDENGKTDSYLNISIDGELVVLPSPRQALMKGSPEPEPEPQSQLALTPKATLPYFSYFDVHKDSYKALYEKLNDHKNLVDYVTTWECIVTKRVETKYEEYAKHRNSLNHYTKKFNSLLQEEDRLKQKGKPMKPKQIEKMERNQDKLTDARQTHDSSGESLLMLMDEVILRAHRDAFPLLKRSIDFEKDFADINQKHMAKLAGALDLLEIIGKKESLSMEGRLESFQNMNPEDIYTGSKKFREDRE